MLEIKLSPKIDKKLFKRRELLRHGLKDVTDSTSLVAKVGRENMETVLSVIVIYTFLRPFIIHQCSFRLLHARFAGVPKGPVGHKSSTSFISV